jgi:hypothetical protein
MMIQLPQAGSGKCFHTIEGGFLLLGSNTYLFSRFASNDITLIPQHSVTLSKYSGTNCLISKQSFASPLNKL